MSGSDEDALPASLAAVCPVLPWLKEEQLALRPFLSEQGHHHVDSSHPTLPLLDVSSSISPLISIRNFGEPVRSWGNMTW